MFELKITNTPVTINGVEYFCEPYNGNDSRTRLADFEVPENFYTNRYKIVSFILPAIPGGIQSACCPRQSRCRPR